MTSACRRGLVDAVAHHDGDRLDDAWQTVQRLDPMTAWSTGSTRNPGVSSCRTESAAESQSGGNS